MSIKPNIRERISRAEKELNKDACEADEIVNILQNYFKQKDALIDGVAYIETDISQINYKKISCDYGTNDDKHIIWITFVDKELSDGRKRNYAAVVGAGKDIGFSKDNRRGTWKILCHLGVRWDKTKVIIIPIRGLKSIGLKKEGMKISNILECRNGVEHFIGEYLIESGVPILNSYQHINYSKSYWNKCKNYNFNI